MGTRWNLPRSLQNNIYTDSAKLEPRSRPTRARQHKAPRGLLTPAKVDGVFMLVNGDGAEVATTKRRERAGCNIGSTGTWCDIDAGKCTILTKTKHTIDE